MAGRVGTVVQNVPGVTMNGRSSIEHLKHQYRLFGQINKNDIRKKPVLWRDFPITFRQFYVSDPVLTRGRWRTTTREVREVTKRLDFVARIDEFEVTARAYSGWYAQYSNSTAKLVHKFVAPFGPMNDALLLETSFPLFMRGDEASVVLDEAMENGFKHGADFERIKKSNYVRVESEAFRLFMSANAKKWPPFELVFDVEVWMGCPWAFTIEPLPQPSVK